MANWQGSQPIRPPELIAPRGGGPAHTPRGLLVSHPFFPVGIRKTRGIVNKSPRPNEMKVALKPLSGVEPKWRMIVINEIPNAPPTYLNIPRMPVIVATLSGISSIHALFEAGRAIPIPIPVNNIRTARISATPKCVPGLFSNGSPWPPRRMVEREMMVKPDTIGHRYPHRLSKK